jgi:hypothetical protein
MLWLTATVVATAIVFTAAVEPLYAGTTLLKNDVGAYPLRDTFRYSVRLTPAIYETRTSKTVSIPRGTYFRVELSVVGPTSRFQYLNLSRGEAGLRIIRAVSPTTGRVVECNSSTAADVLQETTDLNSVDGITQPNAQALNGYATFEAPAVPFRICYRPSVSRYVNATWLRNSTSAWNRGRIPPSWRRGTTYKDLWEPLDRTFKFAWQAPARGGETRPVNASQVRYAIVGNKNATLAGEHGALRLEQRNFSATYRFRSDADVGAGDLIKLVPAGEPCVRETPFVAYPGLYGTTISNGVLSSEGLAAAARGSATGTVAPVGTETVNWLTQIHTASEGAHGLRTAFVYLRFPTTPGRYDVCYLGFEERSHVEADTTNAADQAPGWRKLYQGTRASSSVASFVVGVRRPDLEVRWDADSVEALSWTRIVFRGLRLAGGKAARSEALGVYPTQAGADAMRLVRTDAFAPSTNGVEPAGCWFRGLESVADNTGDRGPNAVFDLAGVPRDERQYPLQPWTAPPNQTVLAAFVRLPRVYQQLRVCYRRSGGFWAVLPGVLTPRPAALNVSWTLRDQRADTFGAWRLEAPGSRLSTMPATYASAPAGSVWFKVVRSTENCMLAAALCGTNDVSSDWDSPNDNTPAQAHSVYAAACIPNSALSPSGRFRLCVRVGSGPFHAIANDFMPVPYLPPQLEATDWRAGVLTRVQLTPRQAFNLTGARFRLVRNSSVCAGGQVADVTAPVALGCDATSVNCSAAQVAGERINLAFQSDRIAPPQTLAAVVDLNLRAGLNLRLCLQQGGTMNWEPLQPIVRILRRPIAQAALSATALVAGMTLNVTVVIPGQTLDTVGSAVRLAATLADCALRPLVAARLRSIVNASASTYGVSAPPVTAAVSLVVCGKVLEQGTSRAYTGWLALASLMVTPSPVDFDTLPTTLVPGGEATIRFTSQQAALDSGRDRVKLLRGNTGLCDTDDEVVGRSDALQYGTGSTRSEVTWTLVVPYHEARVTLRVCYFVSAAGAWVAVPRAKTSRLLPPPGEESFIAVADAAIYSVEFSTYLYATDEPTSLIGGSDTGDEFLAITGRVLNPHADLLRVVALRVDALAYLSPAAQCASSHPRGATTGTMSGNATVVYPRIVLPTMAGTYMLCYWHSATRTWVRAQPTGNVTIVENQLHFAWSVGRIVVWSSYAGSRSTLLTSLCALSSCATFETAVRFYPTNTSCSDGGLSIGATAANIAITWAAAEANNGSFAIPSPLAAGDFRVCVLRANPTPRESNLVWRVAASNGTMDPWIASRPRSVELGLSAMRLDGVTSNWTIEPSTTTGLRVAVSHTVDGAPRGGLSVESPMRVSVALLSMGVPIPAEIRLVADATCSTASLTGTSAAFASLPFSMLDGELELLVTASAACTEPCELALSPLGLRAALPASRAKTAASLSFTDGVLYTGYLSTASPSAPAFATADRPLRLNAVAVDRDGRRTTSTSTIAVLFFLDPRQHTGCFCHSGCTVPGPGCNMIVAAPFGNVSLVVSFTETRSFIYRGLPTNVTMTTTMSGRSSTISLAIKPLSPSRLAIISLTEVSASTEKDVMAVETAETVRRYRRGAPPPSDIIIVDESLLRGRHYRVRAALVGADGVMASSVAAVGDTVSLTMTDGGLRIPGTQGDPVNPTIASGNMFVLDFEIASVCRSTDASGRCVVTLQSTVFRFIATVVVRVDAAPSRLIIQTPVGIPLVAIANTTALPEISLRLVDSDGVPVWGFAGIGWAFVRELGADAIDLRAPHERPQARFFRGVGVLNSVSFTAPCEACTLSFVTSTGVTADVMVSSVAGNGAVVISHSQFAVPDVPMVVAVRVVRTDGTPLGWLTSDVRFEGCSGSVTCSPRVLAGSSQVVHGVATLLVEFPIGCDRCTLRVTVPGFGTGYGPEITVATQSALIPTVMDLSAKSPVALAGSALSVSVTLGVGALSPETLGSVTTTLSCSHEAIANASTAVFGDGGMLSPRSVAVTSGAATINWVLTAPCLACRITCTAGSATASLMVTVLPVPERIVATDVPSALRPVAGDARNDATAFWAPRPYIADAAGHWAYHANATLIVDVIGAVEGESVLVVNNASLHATPLASSLITIVGMLPSDVLAAVESRPHSKFGVAKAGVFAFRIRGAGLTDYVTNVTTSAFANSSDAALLRIANCPAPHPDVRYVVPRNLLAVPTEALAFCFGGGMFTVGETVHLDVSAVNASGARLDVNGALSVTLLGSATSCGSADGIAFDTMMVRGRAFPQFRFRSVCVGCYLQVNMQQCPDTTLPGCSARTERFTVLAHPKTSTLIVASPLTLPVIATQKQTLTFVRRSVAWSGQLLHPSLLDAESGALDGTFDGVIQLSRAVTSDSQTRVALVNASNSSAALLRFSVPPGVSSTFGSDRIHRPVRELLAGGCRVHR